MKTSSSGFTVKHLTRREAFRQSSLFLGATLLGSALIPKSFAQPATLVGQSVENADHPIAKMRTEIGQYPVGTEKVAENIFALSGPGGNVGLYVGADGMVAIDSGSGREPSTQRMREAIKSVSDRPLRYLINTHWHFDHTDGNANLHGLGATIVAHRNVRKRLSQPTSIAFFNALFPKSRDDALPTLTFDHEFELNLGSETLHLAYVPTAHTDGDAFVHWEKANVIQTGDLFFSGFFPFIDGGSGGTLEGMIRAEEKILALANDSTRIIPGHGVVSSKKELIEARDMLRTVQDRIGKLRSAGKTLDEVVAEKPFADLDEKWGKGIFNAETFTKIVYGLKA